jgi:hypothetical protein
LCFALPNGCRDKQHPTWLIKIKSFPVGIKEKPASTPPGVLLKYSMSLICMILVADLIACKLDDYLMSAVACKPVTARSGFLVWLL